MTTELPSPPGYRAAPGPGQDDCPVKLYHRGHHHLSNGSSANSVNARTSPEHHHHNSHHHCPPALDKPQQIIPDPGYCKKNAPGYKNDSGYSESLGFESFSLPLSERDAASPPPTPPVRDASSLKSVCYGPGHEKYPSWPTAPECRNPSGSNEDDDSQSASHGGSHRSKSWTDHTNYPKEKPAQYTRPHNKRPNATFTQQLKTVMERCEKIPAEAFESRGRSTTSSNVSSEKEQQQQQHVNATRMWPSVDREGKALGDAEYVVPSPPERESLQAKTLSPADLEAYVRSYQDPQVSQVELYGDSDLTQTGLDEYTTVQHSQQASYAQSEGYHSYVSSVDSTTTTPFLDRLRRDSEAVAQRPLSSWEDGSREGRDSVVTTSSGSASSSETLKWHGSMSDVSVSSGMPSTSRSSGIGTQDRWHHGSMSDISSINGSGGACPQMLPIVTDRNKNGLDDHDSLKWQDSMIDHHHNQHHLNNHHGHNRLSRTDSWQVNSMNDRNKEVEDKPCWDARTGHSLSKSYHSVADASGTGSSLICGDQQTTTVNEWENSIHSSMSDVSQSNGGQTATGATQTSKQLIAHSARVQTPQRHHSESVLYLDHERSQRKLYPVSTTKLEENHSGSRPSASGPQSQQQQSPQTAQPTVAERVSELEKQQMRYTYLDPEKRHRVSDPTLKAIQKKALLSFYERHHQASWRSEPHLQQQQQQQQQQPQQSQNPSTQRHSPPPQPPPRPRPASSRRASSASDYASGLWRDKSAATAKASPQKPSSPMNGSTPSNSSDLPAPRHQHSNSCGSLSTDLLGPVIIGPAISIDDWVPERPPKKPHLRHAYSERLPSPDLPPPSPPTVTDVEVLNCDDPLPPPPPELSQVCSNESTRIPSPEQRRDNSAYFDERPTERIKERNSSSRRSSRKKAPIEVSPTISPAANSPTKSQPTSPSRDGYFDYKSSNNQSVPEVAKSMPVENGFASSRATSQGNRSSARYSSSQKHLMNEKIAAMRRSTDDRLSNQLPDLVAQKYSDSGHQRPAPQVPVSVTNNISCRETQLEPKIKRRDSFSPDDAKQQQQQTTPWLDCSTRQKPRPQVPKTSPVVTTTTAATSNGIVGNTSPTSPRPLGAKSPRNNLAKYMALPPKYSEAPPALDSSPPPPPLAPRKKLSPPPRPAPLNSAHQGSQSKASYLAYRRERGAPDCEGSYKRTMSPNARLDDPVLLKVTPHQQQQAFHNNNNNVKNNNINNNNQYQSRQQQQHHHHNNNNNNSHPRHELSKSQSSDALEQYHHSQHQQRLLDDQFSRKSVHNVSCATSSASEDVGNGNGTPARRQERRERLSPQSVEVLNDRNRQLERERRKLAASCEPQSRLVEDFYRESGVTTIEMTSQNVEMLNRRNAAEKQRLAAAAVLANANNANDSRSTTIGGGSPKLRDSPTTPTSPSATTTSITTATSTTNGLATAVTAITSLSERKVSSPTQTDRSGASWDRKSISTNSSSQSHSPSSPSSPMRVSPRSDKLSTSSGSPCDSPSPPLVSPETQSLTLLQRTEVVLRVNAPTNDVASQTETPEELGKSMMHQNEGQQQQRQEEESLAKPRKKLQEEIECEELSRDLANQLGPNDKLLPILVPVPEHKKSTDYVVDLFRVEAAIQARPRPRVTIEEPQPATSDNESEDGKRIDSIPSTPVTPSAGNGICASIATTTATTTSSTDPASSPLSSNSAYFASTSEGKARFLTRHSSSSSSSSTTTSSSSQDVALIVGEQVTDKAPATPATSASINSSTTPSPPPDSLDLRQKKEELMIRLDKKLVVLRAEQEAVREEGEVNEALGARVSSRVGSVARPAEASKYRLHVEEVGKITSLLLGLSGRLARAENALYGMSADHAERKALEAKRDKLIDQLEEAKILKSNIDRRSVNVSNILAKYLNDEEFADYQHFINMKAKLIVESREIQDKVRMGEEQLAALKEAIDL